MATEPMVGIASPTSATDARNDSNRVLFWRDDPSVRRLLDVIASLLAAEYTQVAKKNPKVFRQGELI